MNFKKIFSFLIIMTCTVMLSGCVEGKDDTNNLREITDMAGRLVSIPKEIDSVFSTISSGTMMLYSIDPSLLVGFNFDFNKDELDYISEAYRDLPSYGQGGKINKEAIIAASPDIIVTYGALNQSDIDFANAFMGQTGIPVVMVDGALHQSPQAYRFLGEILGLTEKTDLLATYAEDALAFADSIPVVTPVKVYYGNGEQSLETVPKGSSHAEIFDLVDVDNVAISLGEVVTRIEITPEQIIGWNPEVIILNGEPSNNITPVEAVEMFKANVIYQNVSAVVHDHVYAIPKTPYSWFDRPQSTNRLIGIYWLAETIYPDLVTIDVRQAARDYYQLFYHMDLTIEQLDAMLGN